MPHSRRVTCNLFPQVSDAPGQGRWPPLIASDEAGHAREVGGLGEGKDSVGESRDGGRRKMGRLE